LVPPLVLERLKARVALERKSQTELQ